MPQLAASQSSASTQTVRLQISDNDYYELCNSVPCFSDYHHYYSVPAESTKMPEMNQVIYETPNCEGLYAGTSSQTDLSLSFLDLSIASDDDDDFVGSDDSDERRPFWRLNESTIVEEDNEDDDDDVCIPKMEAQRFMLDLLNHIKPSSPPTLDSSSSEGFTPGSSSYQATDTSSSSSSKKSSSSSSSLLHNRSMEFDGDPSSTASPTLEHSKSNNSIQNPLPERKKSKLKRPVPRMGTRIDLIPRPTIFANHHFLSPSPPSPPHIPISFLSSASSTPSPLQFNPSSFPSHHQTPPPLSSPNQQHIYQDLVFDLSHEFHEGHNLNNNNTQEEPFYHVLSPKLVAQQQQQRKQQQQFCQQQQQKLRNKSEHRVTFDLRKSNEEDIYENDYELESLLNELPIGCQFSQCPPPLPKRPVQVKFTPIVQSKEGTNASSGSESSSTSSTLAVKNGAPHSSQPVGTVVTTVNGEQLKNRPALERHKSLAQPNIASGSHGEGVKLPRTSRESSIEGEIRGRRENKAPRDMTNRNKSVKSPENSGNDRKVVVIGEGGVESGKGEIYGKLAEIMYTNRANLHHTIMLQQKLFQQQLQAGPSLHSNNNKTIPAQNDQENQHHLLQNPWNVVHPRRELSTPSISPPHPTEWVIRRRPDGTRYITRRGKHSKVRESKAEQKNLERNATAPSAVPMVVPIFRAKKNRDKLNLSGITKEGNKNPPLIPKIQPIVQVDSFIALQNVLQGKMPPQSHSALLKQNQTLGKPLLSVTTI